MAAKIGSSEERHGWPNNKPRRVLLLVALILQFVVVRLIQDSILPSPIGRGKLPPEESRLFPPPRRAGLASFISFFYVVSRCFSFPSRTGEHAGSTGSRHSPRATPLRPLTPESSLIHAAASPLLPRLSFVLHQPLLCFRLFAGNRRQSAHEKGGGGGFRKGARRTNSSREMAERKLPGRYQLARFEDVLSPLSSN